MADEDRYFEDDELYDMMTWDFSSDAAEKSSENLANLQL